MHRIVLAFIVGFTANVGLAQEMPANIRDQIEKNYIGEWDFSMKGADGTFRGSYTAKWAPGKHCVMVSEEATGPQGKVHNTGILAWQPDTKTVVHHGFISNGDYFRILYNKFEGNKWFGRVTGLVNGERPEDSDAVVVWMKDRIVYEDAVYRFEAERSTGKQEKSAAKIVGNWNMLVEYGQGQGASDYVLRITKTGDQLQGVLVSPRSGEHEVKSVKWKDEDSVLELRIERDLGGTELELSFEAKLSEEGLSGKVSIVDSDQLDGTWSAKKKKQ